MAITIQFEGWVNEIKETSWGAFVTVAHDQRAKNDSTGEWETIGKDYVDVSVKTELLPIIRNAKVVNVVGTLKAGAFIKRDGTAGVSLKVNAKEITPVERGARRTDSATAASNVSNFLGGVPLEDAPF